MTAGAPIDLELSKPEKRIGGDRRHVPPLGVCQLVQTRGGPDRPPPPPMRKRTGMREEEEKICTSMGKAADVFGT